MGLSQGWAQYPHSLASSLVLAGWDERNAEISTGALLGSYTSMPCALGDVIGWNLFPIIYHCYINFLYYKYNIFVTKMPLNHEMLCGLKLGKATSLELPTSCIMLVDNSLAAHPCGPLTPTYKHTHTLPWCIGHYTLPPNFGTKLKIINNKIL